MKCKICKNCKHQIKKVKIEYGKEWLHFDIIGFLKQRCSCQCTNPEPEAVK